MTGNYAIIGEAQRRLPDEATIAAIRARYPVEPEIDAVLTRKMHRRHGPGYVPATLERLVDGMAALITARVGHPVEIADARWLGGGASKLQVLFDLHWRGPDGSAPRKDTLVLRMEPSASVTESSRYREFEVLEAVQGIIPSPKPWWVDGEGAFLPYPALIYGFVTGVAKPSYDSGKVTGLGQNYGPALRARLSNEFIGMLGSLHRIDVSGLTGMAHFARPKVGSNQAAVWRVNALRRVWEEDRVEEEPVLEVVYRWLIANAPPLDHVSIVHGDYRSGNFLFDEEAGRITAWLDWEGASLGDRHQDLTYAAMPSFSHYAEDDKTLLASGMMSADEFYAAYERASGLPVDPVRLTYYGVFNRYLIAVLTIGAAARASRSRGTHQDVLVNFLIGLGRGALGELRDYFMEAMA